MMDAWTLRIVIAVLGLVLLAAIFYSGRPKASQGRRVGVRKADRVEPQIGAADAPVVDDLDPEFRAELDRLGREIASDRNDAMPEAAKTIRHIRPPYQLNEVEP